MPTRRGAVRWLAWWYLAISLGFVLLSIVHAIMQDKAWLIGLRVIIAAGFALLAFAEFRGVKRNR